MGKAEVEERALVRFTLFTALRERRVTPREVSIVLDGDENNDDDGENVWMCVGERIRSKQCEIINNIQTQIQLRQHPAQPDSYHQTNFSTPALGWASIGVGDVDGLDCFA
jgi:hypothetical protein